MIDEEWEELEAKVVSIVCISLAFEIKHNILNEYLSNLWEKLEKNSKSKSNGKN